MPAFKVGLRYIEVTRAAAKTLRAKPVDRPEIVTGLVVDFHARHDPLGLFGGSKCMRNRCLCRVDYRRGCTSPIAAPGGTPGIFATAGVKGTPGQGLPCSADTWDGKGRRRPSDRRAGASARGRG
jgi:hypothetical protein